MADPDLLHPIHPKGPGIAAQALYARDVEWACRPEDVLRRRTTLALRGLAGEDVVGVLMNSLRLEAAKSLAPPAFRHRQFVERVDVKAADCGRVVG